MENGSEDNYLGKSKGVCEDVVSPDSECQKRTAMARVGIIAVVAGGILAAMSLVGMLLNWSSASAMGTFETGFWIVHGILAIPMVVGCFLFGKGLRERKKAKASTVEVAQAVEETGSMQFGGVEAGSMQPNGATGAVQSSTTAGAAQAALNQAKQMLAMLSESLDEKETRLYNLKEELAALELQEGKERELTQDIQALELAAEEIERLAREFCEDMEDSLNAEVSRYVSAITEGKYDSVRVGEKGELRVLADGKEITPDALSRGTLEQFHLALRLAVGNVVMKEEVMPIFLDETFAMYDDKRLAQTLKVLSGMNCQVLLFTCQKREMEVLDRLGVPYHGVLLAEG